MVLIIFIAEIAAAVVALVYTSLVSGISESWVGLIWDLAYPFGKTEDFGWLVVLPMDGEDERWALLWEEGMLVPAGTSYVGRLGWPGWGEGGGNRDSHCPKELRVWHKFCPRLSFKTLSTVPA